MDGEVTRQEPDLPPQSADRTRGASARHREIRQPAPSEQVDEEDNPDRCERDAQLIAALARHGFSGPLYDKFETELVRYAVSVLCSWMQSTKIFAVAAAKGRPLKPSEAELRRLATDPEARQGLAHMTIASALGEFRIKALQEGGWRADGGASIATYFVHACALHFPNEFRRERRRWRGHLPVARDENGAVREPGQHVDPVALALGNIRVRDALRRLDGRARAVVALHLDGYEQQEIADALGLRSARAVEGILYRWKKAQQEEQGKEGDGDA